jgi:hypothetical protein
MNTYCPQCVAANEPVASDNTARAAAGGIECVALRAGDVLPVDRRLHGTIQCLDGRIWVTHEGDSRDVVLSAGRSFAPSRSGRVVVQALSAARVRLIASR